jgi:1-aminocyclopropane-1-carboxylate deaminase/D-cysteine desulfhydrase-like pyridoxal-dependent ACC family enzyme
LLTHLKYRSELHYSPNNDIRKLTTLAIWLEHYKKDGQVPYIIPTGGSNMIGALGFVTAAFELAAQIKAGVMPMPTLIYVPTGSCGTTAGLLLGCKAAGITAQIVAVAVEPDEDPTFAQNIEKLFTDMNLHLHRLDATFPIFTYGEKDIRIDLGFTGPDYGIFTTEGIQAAELLQKSEGITLEGTYTAKAFAGLLHDVKTMAKATVLFWNTYCGFDFSEQLDGLDYKKLPRVFHDYFDDKNLQPLA